jgi:hypothetical protein
MIFLGQAAMCVPCKNDNLETIYIGPAFQRPIYTLNGSHNRSTSPTKQDAILNFRSTTSRTSGASMPCRIKTGLLAFSWRLNDCPRWRLG